MKKFITTCLFLAFLSIFLFSQNKSMFDYKVISNSISKSLDTTYLVTPAFANNNTKGTQGPGLIKDEKNEISLLNNIINEILIREKRDQVHFQTQILLYYNSSGEIVKCNFFLDKRDKNLISEDDLFKLYSKFKKLRFDPENFKIQPLGDGTQADFAVVSMSLMSEKNNQNRINENRAKFEEREKLLNKQQ